MPFYHYRQNNSGGSFDIDPKAGISINVIIEADDTDEADDKANLIGLYFDGCDDGRDCDCCGDRWHRAYGKGDPEPMVYGEPLASPNGGSMIWAPPGKPETYVHWADREFEAFHIQPAKAKKGKK